MKHEDPDYVFSTEFAEERVRLAGLEALWDPGSRSLLTELGLGAGWRCLEIGAGGGSLVTWMANQGARVTAVDIDTRFIDHLASESIAVRRLDLRTDDLPDGAFDLVHARLVLEHLVDRRNILDKMSAALRPGGWLVVEAADMRSFSWGNGEPSMGASAVALTAAMQQSGLEPEYGRQIVADLVDAGFREVRGEGRANVIDGRCPGFDWFRLTFERIRQTAVEGGMLSAADAAATTELLADASTPIYTPVLMAGIARL